MWYVKLAQDHFERMVSQNMNASPEAKQAQEEYLGNISGLHPEMNHEDISDHFDKHLSSLRKIPSFGVVHQSYEDWRREHPDELVEKVWMQHKDPGVVQKAFESSGESDFEAFRHEKLEAKAREMWAQEADVKHMGESYGVQTEEPNTFAAFNDVRKQWAYKVAEHLSNQIPQNAEINPNGQTVTLVIGHPGSGKSTFIEPQGPSSDSPIRSTPYGILVDSDEYQKYLVGYHGGAGSGNTLVYAISNVKPAVLNSALEKGHDIVVPITGGVASTLIGEVAKYLSEGHKVRVVLKDVDKEEAYQRSIERARAGGRLIQSTKSDPPSAFKELQLSLNSNSPELDTFITKILDKMGMKAKEKKQFVADGKVQPLRQQLKSRVELQVV